MDAAHADQLRRLRAAVRRASSGPLGQGELRAPLEAVGERLDRDLLPRTAGDGSLLVLGLVGPNNAGKSSTFNGLAGHVLSPSSARGGATRRLVGALHPATLMALEAEPSLAGFPLRRAAPGGSGVAAALEDAIDPAELLVVEVPDLPEGLLLVDAPDFDSVETRNRDAAEALARVLDLALVVVTRHTYQNKEVVEFLQRWLAHGRPWLLVYNESLGEEITAEHAAKLTEDVGAAPVAVFHAPFQPEVAAGRAPLLHEALEGGLPLAAWLREHPQRAELKARALAASLQQLDDEVAELVRRVAAGGRAAGQLRAALVDSAIRTGREVAVEAMPMAPFLEAFREVLDRRPALIPTGYRGALRRAREAAQGAWSRMPWRRDAEAREAPDDAPDRLLDAERQALGPRWPPLFERLAAQASEARGLSPRLVATLAEELTAAELVPAGARAATGLENDPEVLAAFQRACEARIEEELEGRRDEWFLQLAVDAVHLVPAAVAGIVMFKTGGLGADVAVGGAGAVSSLAAERLSRLLGSGVARAARQRWSELRGASMGEGLARAALPEGLTALEREARDGQELSHALASWKDDR